MRKIRTSKLLMFATIIVIVAFQSYWISKLYKDEWSGLKKRTDVLLKETVQKVIAERIRKSDGFIPPENIETIQVISSKNGKSVSIQSKKDPPKRSASEKSFVALPLPKDMAGATVIMSSDSGTTFTRGTRPPNVDSLIMRAKAMGAPMRIIINDSTHSGLSFRKKVEYSSTYSAEKLPSKTLKRDSIAAKELSHQKNFIRIAAGGKNTAFVSDSLQYRNVLVQFNAIMDSIPLKRLDTLYKAALKKEGIKLPFTLAVKKFETNRPDSVSAHEMKTNYALVGFNKPYGYQASFDNPFNFIITKLNGQILFSLFLIVITLVSFLSLYRNLVAQQRLTGIKNDFISNITHELKTPIATVGVAIEALRNFNAIKDPEKTKEYLDISASELQRLSLLVDKVLKLSMFENKDVELKKENFDLKQLTDEVAATMRLQFEKAKAKLMISADLNDHYVSADKLHITSVIYNLLDNALKYSPVNPSIQVEVLKEGGSVILRVSDNGIGIEPDYKDKVFDKFFRVPSNDHHNIKGYGLGLSYVNHVVKKHEGTIGVESEPGKGSTFTVKLPAA